MLQIVQRAGSPGGSARSQAPCQLGVQHLEGHQPVVPKVAREIDGGHAAAAELALDDVSVAEIFGQLWRRVRHVDVAERVLVNVRRGLARRQSGRTRSILGFSSAGPARSSGLRDRRNTARASPECRAKGRNRRARLPSSSSGHGGCRAVGGEGGRAPGAGRWGSGTARRMTGKVLASGSRR